MNNEDYVSYELALKLKACGFDEPCHYHYDSDRGSHIIEPNYTANDGDDCQYITADDLLEDNNGWQYCSAPTLAHAQKWLREKKGIVVIAEPDWDSEDYCMADYLTGEWYFSVWKDGDRVHCNFDPNAEEERIWMFEKYEQALSAGIAAALELIKKGE